MENRKYQDRIQSQKIRYSIAGTKELYCKRTTDREDCLVHQIPLESGGSAPKPYSDCCISLPGALPPDALPINVFSYQGLHPWTPSQSLYFTIRSSTPCTPVVSIQQFQNFTPLVAYHFYLKWIEDKV